MIKDLSRERGVLDGDEEKILRGMANVIYFSE
jgi:hypothetical protein